MNYQKDFSHADRRWSCTFSVSLTGTEMAWKPVCSPRFAPIWRTYRRWRNRCLDDFAERTGVRHEIAVDVPWAGFRVRRLRQPSDSKAAYAWAAAHYSALSNAATSAAKPRAELLENFGAVMLANTPEGSSLQ
jgi:hypothetical protein